MSEAPGDVEANESQTPLNVYANRLIRFELEIDDLTAQSNRVSNARLVVAAVAALLAAIAIFEDIPWLFPPAVLLLIPFLFLVVRHRRLSQLIKRAEALAAVNREAIARCHRDWASLPLRNPWQPAASHPFANDIDVFGTASLYHLIDTTSTGFGMNTLRDWLLKPATPEEIVARQPAVAELNPAIEWRQQLAVDGRLGIASEADLEQFLDWAESPPRLLNRPAVLWLARICTVAVIFLFVLALLGYVPFILLVIPVAINYVLRFIVVSESADEYVEARAHLPAIDSYRAMLKRIESRPYQAQWLRSLNARLQHSGNQAYLAVAQLDRLTNLARPAGSFLNLPLHAIGWDLHLLYFLEQWKVEHGAFVRGWLATIGEFEAISALANTAFDQPQWAYPQVDIAFTELQGVALGHPLIPDEQRVGNDLSLGPSGKFLLVTGSNMSGKSTLLRGIGLNTVLAGAGSPVCAESFSSRPVELWTSARVRDSLAEGVSFYMAELLRLKRIVDAAQRACKDQPVLYLLDEILQGTNTNERHIAAVHVINTLTKTTAIGAVSTHDLSLASEKQLKEAATNVHFTDSIGHDQAAPTMSFDYRLLPGLSTSTNALKLMKMVGFDIAPD